LSFLLLSLRGQDPLSNDYLITVPIPLLAIAERATVGKVNKICLWCGYLMVPLWVPRIDM